MHINHFSLKIQKYRERIAECETVLLFFCIKYIYQIYGEMK